MKKKLFFRDITAQEMLDKGIDRAYIINLKIISILVSSFGVMEALYTFRRYLYHVALHYGAYATAILTAI